MPEDFKREEIKIEGAELVKKVKELIQAGNVRRIIIKQDDQTLLEIPLTIGVAGVAAMTLFAPALVAIGAIAGIVTKCTLIVERIDTKT
jgi:hypothetical protein